jgi:hypothetical protein
MWAAFTGALAAVGEAIAGAATAVAGAISLPLLIVIAIVVGGAVVLYAVYA